MKFKAFILISGLIISTLAFISLRVEGSDLEIFFPEYAAQEVGDIVKELNQELGPFEQDELIEIEESAEGGGRKAARKKAIKLREEREKKEAEARVVGDKWWEEDIWVDTEIPVANVTPEPGEPDFVMETIASVYYSRFGQSFIIEEGSRIRAGKSDKGGQIRGSSLEGALRATLQEGIEEDYKLKNITFEIKGKEYVITDLTGVGGGGDIDTATVNLNNVFFEAGSTGIIKIVTEFIVDTGNTATPTEIVLIEDELEIDLGVKAKFESGDIIKFTIEEIDLADLEIEGEVIDIFTPPLGEHRVSAEDINLDFKLDWR